MPIVTRPFVNTWLLLLAFSRPKRMMAKLTPMLTSGISSEPICWTSLVTPPSSTSPMAKVMYGCKMMLSSLEEKLLMANSMVLFISFLYLFSTPGGPPC